jgi:hypothetical protein
MLEHITSVEFLAQLGPLAAVALTFMFFVARQVAKNEVQDVQIKRHDDTLGNVTRLIERVVAVETKIDALLLLEARRGSGSTIRQRRMKGRVMLTELRTKRLLKDDDNAQHPTTPGAAIARARRRARRVRGVAGI